MIQVIPYRVAYLTGKARARPHKGFMILQVQDKIVSYHPADRDQSNPLSSRFEWRDAVWEDIAGSFDIGKSE